MADGFARASGAIGVCSATSGPGCTNLLTAVSSAYVEGVPMLVITGQSAISTFGRGAMQEGGGSGADTILMFRGCTPLQHPRLASRAARAQPARGAQPCHRPHAGPGHLSIPQDIFRAPSESNRHPMSRYAFFGQEITPDRLLLNRLKILLRATVAACW